MSALSIQVPFPVFNDRDGQPLDNGYVWIGVANLPPQTNPVNVYFDEALTILAPQPLRTINGYVSRAGTPAQLYINGVNFSILVQDSKGSMVYNFPEGTGAGASAVVNVKDFGAIGDGVADDTAAIQAALNTGEDVFVPGTSAYYKLTSALNMANKQRLYGEGERSTLRQITSLQNVVVGSSRTGCTVDNLRIYAVGDISSYSDGAGIIFFSSSRCAVRNCLVENHRGAGVSIYSSNDCVVENNIFLNSPVANLEPNTNSLADIAVVFSSSRNIVQGNICRSGQATGIIFQSISGNDACDDNIADSNIVGDCKAYGIVAYRVGGLTSGNSTSRAVISNNVIRNISGTILNSIPNNYSFGSGVYLQGAEDSVVIGNTIKNTHSGSVTFAQTLAPGAIGATNMTRFVIDGNVIDQEKMFGIHVGDPNTGGEPVGQGIISNNKISNATLTGITCINRGNLIITGNAIDTTGSAGIRIGNTLTQRNNIAINGNQVKNSGSTSNIEANFVNNLTINDNQTNTGSVHGISVLNSSKVSVKSNNVQNATSRSIQITSTCSEVMVCDNLIAGTGATIEGIRLDAVTLYDNNQITGCLANYVGTFAPYNTLTVNSATPSVIDGKYFISNNTSPTTIIAFTGRPGGPEDGQTIFVVFTNNNTTLKFSGVTNLRGNAGVDRLMGLNDAIRATYRRSNFVWYVDIIAAA
jgi:parallel beta-helix repeat protein